MLLSDIRELLIAKGVASEDVYPLLQVAYEDVINKINLKQSIHPMIINKATKLGGMENKAYIVNTNSEVAFKEILSYYNSNRTDTTPEVYETTPAIIGDPQEVSFGLDNLAEVNDNQTIIPTLFTRGEDIVSGLESTYTPVIGYVYPYPVTVIDNTTANEILCYLSATVDCELNVTVDNILTTSIDCVVGEPRQVGDYVVSCNLWHPAGHEPNGDYVVSCDEWGGVANPSLSIMPNPEQFGFYLVTAIGTGIIKALVIYGDDVVTREMIESDGFVYTEPVSIYHDFTVYAISSDTDQIATITAPGLGG